MTIDFNLGYREGQLEERRICLGVIEDIKAEIRQLIDSEMDGMGVPSEYAYCYEHCLEIIDNHISGKEQTGENA